MWGSHYFSSYSAPKLAMHTQSRSQSNLGRKRRASFEAIRQFLVLPCHGQQFLAYRLYGLGFSHAAEAVGLALILRYPLR